MCVRNLVLSATASLALAVVASSTSLAATVYVAGAAPTAVSQGLTFGTIQLGGAHPSVQGTGGGGAFNFSVTGSTFDGTLANRVYMYDTSAGADLADEVANRGDANFAMMIWDMGGLVNFLRIYPSQDHLNDSNAAADVVEQSLWVSADGDNFTLFSDIVSQSGGAFGTQTYGYGTTNEATTIYRGGSTEFGLQNAYTRDYNFGTAFRWIGIRTSSLGLSGADADPEIDAIAGRLVPLPPAALSALPLLAGIAAMAFRRRRRIA